MKRSLLEEKIKSSLVQVSVLCKNGSRTRLKILHGKYSSNTSKLMLRTDLLYDSFHFSNLRLLQFLIHQFYLPLYGTPLMLILSFHLKWTQMLFYSEGSTSMSIRLFLSIFLPPPTNEWKEQQRVKSLFWHLHQHGFVLFLQPRADLWFPYEAVILKQVNFIWIVFCLVFSRKRKMTHERCCTFLRDLSGVFLIEDDWVPPLGMALAPLPTHTHTHTHTPHPSKWPLVCHQLLITTFHLSWWGGGGNRVWVSGIIKTRKCKEVSTPSFELVSLIWTKNISCFFFLTPIWRVICQQTEMMMFKTDQLEEWPI